MEDQRIIDRHNHLLRIACDAPMSDEFVAALHWMLNYTIDNMINYTGPPVSPPLSVAHVAAGDGPNAPLARELISILTDELVTVANLAAYLLGDGNPANRATLEQCAHQVLIEPVPISTPGALNPMPGRPPPSMLGRISEMSAEQLRVLQMNSRCKLVLATLNRCRTAPNKHGCVLTAMFLSLVTRVPEFKKLVQDDMTREGITCPQQTLMFQYMTSELRTLCLYPMAYDNAAKLWSIWWHTTTRALTNNAFADMEFVIKTREEESFEILRRVREGTLKKREQRARAQVRRRAERAKQNEEDIAEIIDSDDDIGTVAEQLIRTQPHSIESDALAERLGDLCDAADDDLADLLHVP